MRSFRASSGLKEPLLCRYCQSLGRSNSGRPSERISAITQPAEKISIDGCKTEFSSSVWGGVIHLSGAKQHLLLLSKSPKNWLYVLRSVSNTQIGLSGFISAIKTQSNDVIKMLSGFKSPWTRGIECNCVRPHRIWNISQYFSISIRDYGNCSSLSVRFKETYCLIKIT